ncbi:hypothetical protein ACOSQ3_019557 [Xanthoceras sorbifolium]
MEEAVEVTEVGLTSSKRAQSKVEIKDCDKSNSGDISVFDGFDGPEMSLSEENSRLLQNSRNSRTGKQDGLHNRSSAEAVKAKIGKGHVEEVGKLGMRSSEFDRNGLKKHKCGFNYTNKTNGVSKKVGGSRFDILWEVVEDTFVANGIQVESQKKIVLRVSLILREGARLLGILKRKISVYEDCQLLSKTRPDSLKKTFPGFCSSGSVIKVKKGKSKDNKKNHYSRMILLILS